MIHTIYGDGGFDPEKPNNNIIEQFDDGIDAPDEMVQISKSAIDNISDKLQDPTVNTIAEIKGVLNDFFGEIK